MREKVAGTGFLAEVAARGRVLAVEETDGWWFHGVEPGGLAEGARSAAEALHEFCRALKGVLYDVANDAADFDAFTRAVNAFFHEVNEPTAAEWEAAVADVKKGIVTSDRIPPITRDPIEKQDATTPALVEVRYLEPLAMRPDNQLQADLAVAA